ncbi:UNVERIFIED_CONTAM: hypothetical protein RMT77_008624 [Armadillidium vulgare]
MLPMVLIFLIFINFFIPSNLTIFNNSLNNTKKYNESINIEQTIIYNNTSDLEERNFTNTSLNENVTDGNETTTLFPETTESPTTPSSVEDIILDSRIYERNLELQDFCTCDLMASSCDINCCCDPECSDENIMAFAFCKPGKKYIDKLYCIGEHLLFANNTPYKVQIFSHDLLCIVTDNLRDRHYYPNIKGIDSMEKAEDFLKERTSYKWDKIPEKFESKSRKNIFGQVLMVSTDEDAAEDQFKPFELPIPFPSSDCQATESVFYLENFESLCNVQLHNLAVECESQVFLNASRFRNLNFITWVVSTKEMDSSDDVASTTTSQDLSTANFTGGNTTETNKEEEISSRKLSPEFNSTDYEEYIGEYKLIPVTIFICKDLTNEESCTDSKVALNPSNRNGECQHVLKNIHFSVIHNGTYGIEEVVVKIELMRVTDDMKFISQLYKVSFHWVDLNETNVYEKSGSPGYIFGMPVLMGFLQSVENVTEDSEFKEKINLDKNPNNWMTVVGSNGGSECSERVTVKFGINLYSECEINVKLDKNEDICSQLRIKSLLELIGFEYEEENPIRIGMYGDSNILLPVEWVPVILSDDLEHKIITKDNEERSEDFLCSDIVTSIKIEILYASQGPFQNPQSKIIGTLFKLGRSSTLDLKQYQRLDAINSFQNLSIPIELISEVNFVDVTENSKREYPEPPKFDIRLPYDFFYPFLPSGSTQVQSYSDYLVLIISCCFNILIRNACKQ